MKIKDISLHSSTILVNKQCCYAMLTKKAKGKGYKSNENRVKFYRDKVLYGFIKSIRDSKIRIKPNKENKFKTSSLDYFICWCNSTKEYLKVASNDATRIYEEKFSLVTSKQ